MEDDKFKKSEIKGIFDGPLSPVIMRLAMPILAGMVFQLIYTLVDTSFINFIDPANPAILGGTGYIFPILFIAMALANGLSVGMSALVSRGIGEKDNSIMNKTAESGLFLAFIVTVVMLLVCYIFDEELVKMLGAEGEYLKYGLEYFQYILPVAGFMFFSHVLGGILQGEGLMQYFMKAMITGTLLNLILDPFFIFESLDLKLFTLPGLGMGVKGAALATVIAQFFAFIYMLSLFLRKKSLINIEWKISLIDMTVVKKIIHVGLPQSFSQIIMSLSFIVMNRIASHIDHLIVTSSSLVGRVEQLIYMPIFAISAAVVTVTGQNFGRKSMERVEETWKSGLKLSGAIILVTASLFFIFSPEIYGFFQQPEQVTDYAVKQTRYIMPFMALVVINIISQGVFQATGRPVRALIITSMRFCIIVLPLMGIMVYFMEMGFMGMLYAHMIAIVSSAAISLIWMKKTFRQLRNEVREPAIAS